MKKLNLLTACTLTALATTSLTAMAESVDLRVIGTIIPAACTPTLGGGGIVDYGYIKASTLSAADYTPLEIKNVPISITCDAPAKVAIRAINGRPNTLAGGTEGAGGFGSAPIALLNSTGTIAAAGLGLDGTSKVGGFAVKILQANTLVDNNSALTISREGATTAWTLGGESRGLFSIAVIRDVSWSATNTTVPMAFTTMSSTLEVQAYLNKASELDLTKAVALDGLVTLEMVYL